MSEKMGGASDEFNQKFADPIQSKQKWFQSKPISAGISIFEVTPVFCENLHSLGGHNVFLLVNF